MSNIEEFLNHIKFERNELQEDLDDLPLNALGGKVGDFGCGWGYASWCLMLKIPNSKCIGVDKFDPNNPPYLSDIEKMMQGILPIFIKDNVESRSKEMMDTIKSGNVAFQDDDLLNDIRHMIIDEERFPVFQQGNLVTGENLTLGHSDFDFIYCKRFLKNIYLDGVESLNDAVNFIANALKPAGWFCLVEAIAPEHSYIKDDLEVSLKKAGFKFHLRPYAYRQYETLEGTQENYRYLLYHCQKLKFGGKFS